MRLLLYSPLPSPVLPNLLRHEMCQSPHTTGYTRRYTHPAEALQLYRLQPLQLYIEHTVQLNILYSILISTTLISTPRIAPLTQQGIRTQAHSSVQVYSGRGSRSPAVEGDWHLCAICDST